METSITNYFGLRIKLVIKCFLGTYERKNWPRFSKQRNNKNLYNFNCNFNHAEKYNIPNAEHENTLNLITKSRPKVSIFVARRKTAYKYVLSKTSLLTVMSLLLQFDAYST